MSPQPGARKPMTKTELRRELRLRTGVSLKNVTPVLDALVEILQEKVLAGEPVQLLGLGTFGTRKRAARQVFSPTRGHTVEKPAHIVPTFKFSTGFRMKVQRESKVDP